MKNVNEVQWRESYLFINYVYGDRDRAETPNTNSKIFQNTKEVIWFDVDVHFGINKDQEIKMGVFFSRLTKRMHFKN